MSVKSVLSSLSPNAARTLRVRGRHRECAAYFVLAVMLLAVGYAAAAEDGQAGMIRFRRILTPQDRIKDWPLGDGKYLPVDAVEFERLVAERQSRTAGTPVVPAATITAACYEAKLVDDYLVGQASAEVVLAGPGPAMLPWEPCNLALGEIAWDAAEREIESRAVLGLGGDGKLAAMVEHSGRLRFEWSLVGRRESADILSFLFEAPSAPSNELSIELPKGFTPAVSRGLVVGSEPAGEATTRWHIALGGRHRFRLRILPAGTAVGRPQLALLRESRTYDLSLRGVEVSAHWRIQAHNEPLQQVAVLLDHGLQMFSARSGETLVPWSAAPAASGQGTRVVLALPEPIGDAERGLRLTAIGPLVVDRPWRLPRIRAERLFWQEGSITLLTAEPLVADRIAPLGCAQTGTGPLSAPRTGESLQFQAFEPEATVELSLSRPPATPQAIGATAVKLGGEEVAQKPSTEKVTGTFYPKDPEGAAHKMCLSPFSCWVRDCRLESWYQGDGAAQHQATYQLQNSGLGRLRLTLPSDVARRDIRSVSVDGDPAEWKLVATGEETVGAACLTVDLPAGQKFPSVAVRWTDCGSPLGRVGSLTPPAPPEPDLPVLARHWTARLPPGYDCVDTGASSAGGMEQGWTVRHADLTPGEPLALKYVRCASMRLFGTIVFLMVAAAGCWRAADRPALLVSLLGGFGVAAILSPGGYAPIALGGVLAILFCLAWQWMHRGYAAVPAASCGQDARNAGGSDSAPGSTVSRAAQLGLILLGALVALPSGDMARGETPPEQPAAAPLMYRVFVPIDAEKKPTGGKVYVPEPLYQELYRRAAPTEKPQGWLILRATYRGALAAEAVSGRLAVDTLRVQYDLQVFGRGTRVRIPLQAEGANQLPNDILLDGRTIEPQWEPDAAALAFDVAEPGEYRLEMTLRPGEKGDKSNWYGVPEGRAPTEGWSRKIEPVPFSPSAGFDVAIPRVARSRLELTLPDGAPVVEAPSACGAVRIEQALPREKGDRSNLPERPFGYSVQIGPVPFFPPRLVAELGPTDRLTVRWRPGAAVGSVRPAIDAEQFLWLKVQPGSVVLSAKFKLRAAEGQFQQVQLAVDPRLRLLPLSGDDPPTVQTGPESDQSRVLSFRWPRPVAGEATLEATFLLSGATGVGNFRLPRIELLDIRPAKRWMAVSTAPALDGEEQHKRQLETAAVSDFLNAWGAADAKPHAAYRLPAGDIDWAISTRPHEPHTAADQTLTLLYDQDRVDLVLEARLATTSGYVFQHRIAAPPGLKVESVSLREGDVERASRWSQDADGTVTVFLNAAASGPQKLVLHGQLPIKAGKAEPLPPARVERCQLRTATVRLFRRPTVLLSIHGPRQQAVAEPPPGDTVKPELGRFVEAFSWDGSPPPVTITVGEGEEGERRRRKGTSLILQGNQ